MNPTPPPHDDGLEWLRDVRARMLRQADGDFKKLGDRYRRGGGGIGCAQKLQFLT